jgi:hypothetical protein
VGSPDKPWPNDLAAKCGLPPVELEGSRWLLLVNPISGNQQALNTVNELAVPILGAAGR